MNKFLQILGPDIEVLGAVVAIAAITTLIVVALVRARDKKQKRGDAEADSQYRRGLSLGAEGLVSHIPFKQIE